MIAWSPASLEVMSQTKSRRTVPAGNSHLCAQTVARLNELPSHGVGIHATMRKFRAKTRPAHAGELLQPSHPTMQPFASASS